MTNNSIKAAFQRFWEHTVAQLNDKADVNHTHDYADSVHNHDDIYYTESEIDNRFETMGTAFVDAFTTKEETAQAVETIVELMVNKADKDHNHDDIYYTESEIDAKLSEVSESIGELIDVAETKEDASAKLTEAKAYADEVGTGLQTQLNTIVNNPDTEGVINSINEFTQYITEHGEIAEGFRTDINALETEVTGLAAIAKTGSTDDLVQGEMVLVFDCGTAAEWIDENTSTETILDEAILGETTV